ncbi:MAG: alpha/beta fold hydrolase [Dehalococcoidia bacterium]|nr:MAG: alpha/beta fold hydrolase [Dehalococcoidia bacterium]
MPKEKVGDINMYYEIHGEGEPVLLIMGHSGTTALWGPMIPLLSREYRVIAFDNRGIGYSEAPESPISAKTMADDAAGLMDTLGIDSAHVFGASMGGMIAQELVLNYPEKVLCLILGCTSPGGSQAPLPDETAAIAGQLADMSQDDLAKMLPAMFYPPEFMESNPQAVEETIGWLMEKPIPPWVRVRQTETVVAHDTYERLPQIKAPTLVIGGEKDMLIPPEYQRLLASRIPNAQLVMWHDVGHGFLLQKPHETLNVVLDFLRRHPKK